jgi:hypothetical protein
LTLGITIAAITALLGNALGLILAAKWRPRYWRAFALQESELRKSWDRYRTEGLLMTYPKMWKTLPFFVFGIIISVFVIALIAILQGASHPTESSTNDVTALVIFSLFLGVVPSILFIEAFGSDCWVSASEIRKLSPWSRKTCARWNEVQSVSYDKRLKSYMVKTNMGTIRVRAVLQGIGFFLQIVSEEVALEKRSGGFHPINLEIMDRLSRS